MKMKRAKNILCRAGHIDKHVDNARNGGKLWNFLLHLHDNCRGECEVSYEAHYHGKFGNEEFEGDFLWTQPYPDGWMEVHRDMEIGEFFGFFNDKAAERIAGKYENRTGAKVLDANDVRVFVYHLTVEKIVNADGKRVTLGPGHKSINIPTYIEKWEKRGNHLPDVFISRPECGFIGMGLGEKRIAAE